MSDTPPRRDRPLFRTGQVHDTRRERKIIPEHLWDDQRRRANAPRSLTQILCNDPPPGYSALDAYNARKNHA